MLSILIYLLSLIVFTLIIMVHLGPNFARGKTSFWILSLLATAVSIAGWSNYYWNDLAPENFSDVGSPWSMMLYGTLSALALASILMGALRVFDIWRPKNGFIWAVHVLAVPTLAALLFFPVGFVATGITADRWDAAYCASVISHPKCESANAGRP